MSTIGWTLVGVIASALVIAGGVVLFNDVIGGAIGGRKTLERARRLLVVSLGEGTESAAAEWRDRHVATHPDVECTLERPAGGTDYAVFQATERAINKYNPDAVVWVLPAHDRHSHESAYAAARRELTIPMDAVYVDAPTRARVREHEA